jgi:hypothetical protein
MNKYTVDTSFFKNIDSPEKAYFLGWIVSDGSIGLDNALKIRLQKDDSKILNILRRLIKSNRRLKIVSYKDYGYVNRKDQADLSIYNKEICNDLRKLGYDNKKTKSAIFPTFLSDELIPHFVRGLFEGDGCIHLKPVKIKYIRKEYPTKRAQFYICGTKDICMGLERVFNKLQIKSTVREKTGCYEIRICGNVNIYRTLVWLYRDCGILKLNRKYKIFQKLREIESRDKTKDFDFRKRPVKQIDLNNQLIKIWPSATDAVKHFGQTSTGSLVAVCNKRKWFKTYKGFKWEYANN